MHPNTVKQIQTDIYRKKRSIYISKQPRLPNKKRYEAIDNAIFK